MARNIRSRTRERRSAPLCMVPTQGERAFSSGSPWTGSMTDRAQKGNRREESATKGMVVLAKFKMENRPRFWSQISPGFRVLSYIHDTFLPTVITIITPSSHHHCITIAPSSPSSHHHRTTISPPSDHHLTTISLPSHHHRTTIAPPSHYHLTTISSPSHHHHHHLTTIAPPSHHHQTTISLPSHYHLITIAPPSHHHLTTISLPSHHHRTTISPSSHHHLTTTSTITIVTAAT